MEAEEVVTRYANRDVFDSQKVRRQIKRDIDKTPKVLIFS